LFGSFRKWRRIQKAQRVSLPHSRAVRRGDRPVHVGETPGEERNGASQNLVLGLEPCEIRFCGTLPLHFAKTHERMHLVTFAIDGALHRLRPAHVEICLILEQPAVLMKRAPGQAIHQLPSPRIAKMCHGLDEVHQSAR
jgi:hypothetical protein